ncbi:MAG: polyhydroxyalkanoate synthesis repressor PhaR [Rhodospirillales bacterium]
MSDSADGAKPITIKKYANRRLYNTETSSYVTLDHLAQMVKDDKDFTVFDAKTGEDITRSVLTQIIVEEESKGGQNLLPISFLRQLIGFYGDSLGGLVPRYLEHAMGSFSTNQDQMRGYMEKALGGMFPLNQIEELNKQNVAMFENAIKMFAPGIPAADSSEKSDASPKAETKGDDLNDLKSQLEAMQKQLDKLIQDK